jgi:hypothetical protein
MTLPATQKYDRLIESRRVPHRAVGDARRRRERPVATLAEGKFPFSTGRSASTWAEACTCIVCEARHRAAFDTIASTMTDSAIETTRSVSLGFRERPFALRRADPATARWAEAFPGLCRVGLDRTNARRPRSCLLLTLGRIPIAYGPARGSTATCTRASSPARASRLPFAEDCAALAPGRRRKPRVTGLSDVAAARVRDVRFFVLPRMSPDGAETVLTKVVTCDRCRATSDRRARTRTGAARMSTATDSR